MRKPQFQFGIGRLMALTAAVAVVMAVSVKLDVPQFAQWCFAGYLVFFVGWAVMRGPNMYATFATFSHGKAVKKLGQAPRNHRNARGNTI